MVKLLDCTFRDGGYYNDWDFSEELFAEYLIAMAVSGIDFVELGLRNFPQESFLGAFAYTTEQFLNEYELPIGPIYGVMVDAKTIISSTMSIVEAVDALFVDALDSKIGLVRVASHFHEVKQCQEIVLRLKEKGYLVALNLMQACGKPAEELERSAELIQRWGAVDCLYFADSLGNMDKSEVIRVYSCLRKSWHGDIGIHTHDNMSSAISNSISAIEIGACWVDCTVTGMGRGAGNAQTERLLSVLPETEKPRDALPIQKLAINSFEKLKDKYKWGTNLLYFLGARYGIHPTYIQKLLTDSHYSSDQALDAINYLARRDDVNSFDHSTLVSSLEFKSNKSKVSGSEELVDLFKDRKVLLIGKGASVNKYRSHIESFIRKFKPIVININVMSAIDEDLIDYYSISHNVKFFTDFEKYKSLIKPIILPRHRFSEEELGAINPQVSQLDYGFEGNTESLFVKNTFCGLPYELTAGYSLAIAKTGSAEGIFLVGFDGFQSSDPRQIEMVDVLNQFKLIYNGEIMSLTPTTYLVNKGSIFAPYQ